MQRYKTIPVCALAAGVMLAGPVNGQTGENQDQAGNVNPVAEVVCRRMPPPTGSRIGPRRVCKTQHEWDLIDAETRQVMDNVGTRSRVGNEGG